jgi:1,4-dihydroxy-2-naphthoate octaprenyltransferase
MMKPWLSAFRLRTLPLAVSSILVGSALAQFHNGFRLMVMISALITAVLLQILSNLANDLGDHQHGTDNKDRIGPQRAVQSGAISTAAMKRAMIICGVLAFASGIWLILTATGLTLTSLVFLLIGLGAIGAAVKYTFGKNPYGYAGLGDVSVFLFFGLVGVIGTYYLHTRSFTPSIVLPAIAFGLLSTGVLNTNNMRDITNDATSGKRTMVVRMGSVRAKNYHTVLIGGAFIALVVFVAWYTHRQWAWLSLIGLVPIIIHSIRVQANTDPKLLDPELKRLALGTFFTAITFSLGLILAA